MCLNSKGVHALAPVDTTLGRTRELFHTVVIILLLLLLAKVEAVKSLPGSGSTHAVIKLVMHLETVPSRVEA